MNYYAPREIADPAGNGVGTWRYTVRNDDRIWPVGYCAEQMCRHATPEEAREHYRQWELDHRRAVEVAWPGNACRICGALATKGFTTNGYSVYLLCDEHRTREHLDSLVIPGDFMSS